MEYANKAPSDTQRGGPAAERAPLRADIADGAAIVETIDHSRRQTAQRQQIAAIALSARQNVQRQQVAAIALSARQNVQRQQLAAIALGPRETAQRQAINAMDSSSAGSVIQRQIGKSKDGEEICRLADKKVFTARLLPRPSASGTHAYRLTAADEIVDNVSETNTAYDSLNGQPYYDTPTPTKPVKVSLPAVLYHATSGRLGGNMPSERSWFTPNFEDAVIYSNQTANMSLIYRYTVTERLVSGLLLMQDEAQFNLPATTLLAQQGLESAHGWLENRPGVQSVFLKNPSTFLTFSGVCGYTQPNILSVPMGTPVVNTWTDWHGSIDTLKTGIGAPFAANSRAGHLGRYDRKLASKI
jgi:hypothetical protein